MIYIPDIIMTIKVIAADQIYILVQSCILTLLMDFEISNKNPSLAINGVNFGFPFEIFNVFDKRWNSFGSWVIYDNGNPIVVNEDDPAQTVIHTGQGNYATYAKYYDIPSESFYEMTFNYSNCNGGDNEENRKVMPATSVKQKQAHASVCQSEKNTWYILKKYEGGINRF